MTDPVLSRAAVREVDRIAVERYGIPSIVLMENAARSCLPVALDMLDQTSKAALILCGSGNNGGDGLALARHLHNAGALVHILLAGDPSTDDARINLRIAERMKLPISRVDPYQGGDTHLADEFDRLLSILPERALIVDALLGTGLSRDVERSLFSLIKRVNMRSNTAHRVLAIDIPSGLDADLGVPLGIAIRAERTITFAAMKPGLVAVNSNAWTGPVIVGDIGVPRELIAELASRK